MISITAPVRAQVRVHVALTSDVTFYGVPLGGATDVVFVLDRSGSMEGAKLADAKRELLSAIDRMPDGIRIGMVFFDESQTLLSDLDIDLDGRDEEPGVPRKRRPPTPDLLVLSTSARERVHRFVGLIGPGGSTAAVPAIRVAAGMQARHIVFLSDGLANSGGDGNDLVALASELGQRGVRIDTVGLGKDQDFRVLQQMATATGGVALVHD